jgi:chromate transporter
MGVNMSTYVGFITGGIPGGVVGPLGLVTPSIIVIIIVSIFLQRFKQNKTVQDAFYGLRPASTALVCAAGWGIFKLAFIGESFSTALFSNKSFWISVVLAAVIFAVMKKVKLHPVVFIVASAIVGIVFKINI